VFGDGGAYDPATDTWRPLPSADAPSPRYGQTAVWTGTEMVVWGGLASGGTVLGDGAAYNPATNTWRVLPTACAPSPRTGHSAVWTGGEMIVWGGRDDVGQAMNDSGRYVPPEFPVQAPPEPYDERYSPRPATG
jgi:N-acetylneuraminic acid mutarotase